MRVGSGYDLHAFGPGDHVMLAGVRIPHVRGVLAHSDGDVALHALCDALLGALALGDIGQHFPDTDALYKNIDSRKLLRKVKEAIAEHGWKIANVDSTIVAQAPRIAPHMPQMIQNIATDLDIPQESVNIKATTTEKLGFAGREEGIAAHAVVLLEHR